MPSPETQRNQEFQTQMQKKVAELVTVLQDNDAAKDYITLSTLALIGRQLCILSENELDPLRRKELEAKRKSLLLKDMSKDNQIGERQEEDPRYGKAYQSFAGLFSTARMELTYMFDASSSHHSQMAENVMVVMLEQINQQGGLTENVNMLQELRSLTQANTA